MQIAKTESGTIYRLDHRRKTGVIRADDGELLIFHFDGWRREKSLLTENTSSRPTAAEIDPLLLVGKRVVFTIADAESLLPSVKTWTGSQDYTLRLMIELLANQPRVFWTGDNQEELQSTYPRRPDSKDSDGCFKLELSGQNVIDWLRKHRALLTGVGEVDLLWTSDGKKAWFEERVGEVWQRCPDPRSRMVYQLPRNKPLDAGGSLRRY